MTYVSLCLCLLCNSDDTNKSPEDANYTVDILTKCAVSKDELSKKTIKIVPLKEPGEPVVVSIPVSQASFNGLCIPCSIFNLLDIVNSGQ